MTHEDAGKYALKHPPGTKPNEKIAKAIREKSPGGELACETLRLKIRKCQLGAF